MVHGSSHNEADWRRPRTGTAPRCRVVGTSDKESGYPATEMPSNPGLKEGWLGANARGIWVQDPYPASPEVSFQRTRICPLSLTLGTSLLSIPSQPCHRLDSEGWRERLDSWTSLWLRHRSCAVVPGTPDPHLLLFTAPHTCQPPQNLSHSFEPLP